MRPQNSSFKSASTCQNQVMAVYQTKIRQQQQFLKLVRGILPTHLAEHLLHCVVSAKKLLLYADTEEWAAQLRFYQPAILNAIGASNLATVNFIQVRIISPLAKQQASRNISLPSKQNIELIRDNLQAIKDDELKLALLRLSQTLDKLS